MSISPMLGMAWNRLVCNSNIKVDDPKKVQDMVGHLPGGVSLKNIFHYAQTAITGEFRDWDYSMEFKPSKTNMEAYGQEKPPLIDLKRVRKT